MEAGRLRYKAEVQGRPDVPDGRGGFKKGDWTKLAVVPVAMTGLTQKDRMASGGEHPGGCGEDHLPVLPAYPAAASPGHSGRDL